MDRINEEKELEMSYLEKTLEFVKKSLIRSENELQERVSKLISSGKDMWENSSHSSNDFDKIPEMTEHLMEVNKDNRNFYKVEKEIKKYKAMLEAPYFGRFDFKEDNFDGEDKIYIGLHNLMDSDSNEIYVYDWRAPISSIFYRMELGKADYISPVGEITGEVTLKRQYKIERSQIQYFFDSSITINDEILQNVLSRNSSTKMKNIVETVQKEQDIIIRDTDNELLIVQGVAGSGKTSIALHRIAFLLYMSLRLNSNNIIIISPNSIFSNYISNVLPELGEENVREITYEGIVREVINNNTLKIENRNNALEFIINNQQSVKSSQKVKSIEFKSSLEFVKLLDRLLDYYEHKLIYFQDIYYDGKIIETKGQLKNLFLNNKINMPMTKRLKRIENIILHKVHPMRRKRLGKIENIVKNSYGHEFEEKSFSRLLAIKEANVFMKKLRSFTDISYFQVYKSLFFKKGLFFKLAKGLKLPENIEEIIAETIDNLSKGFISFEDSAPLLYIKLKVEGSEEFKEMKQVVIDEAQDYYPIHYKIFSILFRTARFTVLGDINQSIEKNKYKDIYDEIENILNKKRSLKLFLKKGYRSSFEINSFAKKLLNSNEYLNAFERHEEKPEIIVKNSLEEVNEGIKITAANYYKQGYKSIAVVCKTEGEKCKAYESLKKIMDVKLLDENNREVKSGTVIVSSYMAKGLEFDGVIIYNAAVSVYSTELDKKLLYIACTRPLHKLTIYSMGENSMFIR
ncbi:HelD family protein [Clostridium pasteurianum]|uniref:DNA/RNA helicase, superfamily I n=1 Tax=Clostridium pasteurianum BC1 TaxID=86416 RepID=R4K4F7_CLOPA|nr:UvrD-helicase domain-containing protein [Clostridium pasteurianum]AGK96591.1 DNA/RNA helicase, superfamily I [Clostridium pasteurianum BC1]